MSSARKAGNDSSKRDRSSVDFGVNASKEYTLDEAVASGTGRSAVDALRSKQPPLSIGIASLNASFFRSSMDTSSIKDDSQSELEAPIQSPPPSISSSPSPNLPPYPEQVRVATKPRQPPGSNINSQRRPLRAHHRSQSYSFQPRNSGPFVPAPPSQSLCYPCSLQTNHAINGPFINPVAAPCPLHQQPIPVPVPREPGCSK